MSPLTGVTIEDVDFQESLMDSFVARSAAAWSEHWMPFVTGGAFMLVFAFSNGCAGPTFCLVGL